MTSAPDTPDGFTVIEAGTTDGIDWFTAEAPLYGAVNGYVHVPAGHPWHGLDYADIDDDVTVHGGLTYSAAGWIGFDTLHAGDHWPGAPTYGLPPIIEWEPGMVAAEARRLAAQVAEAGR